MTYTITMNTYVRRALNSLTIGSLILFVLRLFINWSIDYWYLSWNLILAFIPLFIMSFLIRWLKKHRMSHPSSMALIFVWLSFLPNSFYIITDYIHLLDTKSVSIMLDIILIFLVTLTGLIAGFASVHMFEKQLMKRYSRQFSRGAIIAIFLASSFAIYLGRYLRWNTWDIVLNPAGLLFDVSDRLINPTAYSNTFSTTAIFFVFLTLMYFAILYTCKPAKK